MSAILKFDFQKKKIITFFRNKLSKLPKKDTILHVTITFSPGGALKYESDVQVPTGERK